MRWFVGWDVMVERDAGSERERELVDQEDETRCAGWLVRTISKTFPLYHGELSILCLFL